jgi:glycosyltransferase involved in cell wall biosynthesis
MTYVEPTTTDQEQQCLRVALLTEGTYPYHPGGVSVWCDQLVRGMAPHRFTIYSIVAASDLHPTWDLPDNVDALHSIALWGDPQSKGSRMFKRVRKTLGHIGDALVEEDDTPGLFSAQRDSANENAATPRRQSSSAKTRRDAEAHDAFEAFAWSMAKPDGGSEFLDGLHRLFDIAHGAPLIDSLRSSESLDVLLAVMRRMQLDDRSASIAPTVVTVADACLALDLIERQLRPLFEPPPVVDLCHATSNGLAVLPGLGAYWTYGTPLIISEHGIYLRERYLSINAFTYSRPVRSILLSFFKHLTWSGYQVATAMAPGSEYNVLWLEANGCDPSRIRPIYNGVDAANFIRSSSEPDVPTLVWLGRIDPLKDVETLLHTFARVREVKPETRLRIFGTASKENRGYLTLCEDLADSLGLGDSVTFEGHVESVLDAYHAGDVVLLTSISEGFPYTLIEAMAAGKATVATDVGGVREATGGAGIIVPPRDPQRMADACLIFLNDIGLRNLVGRAARERILSRFTLDHSLAVFGDLYREVTGNISIAPVFERNQSRTEEDMLEQFVMHLVERFLGPTVEEIEVRGTNATIQQFPEERSFA